MTKILKGNIKGRLIMILKPQYYDDFRCIADKCSFTCCMEWKINIDKETRKKYDELGIEYKVDKDGNAYMPFNECNKCKMLDENGLCSIVKKHGVDYLSYTCDKFPRIYNRRGDDIMECGLSNACPAVLDFFMKLEEPMEFMLYETESGEEGNKTNDNILPVRDFAIDLMQIRDFPLWIRLYILFMIFDNACNETSAEKLEGVISTYNSVDNLLKIYKQLTEIDYEYNKLLDIRNNLFNSVNSNYKDKLFYKKYIENYYEKPTYIDEIMGENKFERFDDWFSKYDNFMENVMINMIFNEVLIAGEDLLDTIYVMLLQQVLIKHTVLLNWCESEQISEINIVEITAYYGRILGHNNNAVTYVRKLCSDGDLNKGSLFWLLR